tara:strand:- start:562 stop:1275 length:714 start_codon:yes stop_codon:yes gene_type:complete
MAIQGMGSSPTPEPHSFVRQAGEQSFTGSPLILDESRGPWTMMLHPGRVTCRSGLIVPMAAKAWHQTGISMNRAGGNGLGFQTQLIQNDGYIAIPHDRPVEAFGVSITEARPSTYLKAWRGVDKAGRAMTKYTNAWEKPEQHGTAVYWDSDEAGRDAWLAEAIELIAPDGLTDRHIRAAVEPIVRRCYALQDRQDPRGRRLLLLQVRHLPADHVPYDLADLYAEATQPKKRKTTPKK